MAQHNCFDGSTAGGRRPPGPQVAGATNRSAPASSAPTSAVTGPSGGVSRVRARPTPAQHVTTRAGHHSSVPPASHISGGAAGRFDPNNEVVVFLKNCGLQMYAIQFLQSGIDELETLQAIEESDLRDLGVPAYHAVRLRKSLEQLLSQEERPQESMPSRSNPVAIFLEENGLGQYSAALIDSGFDEMETLVEIEDADLKDIGLPRGHVLKLRRHLREYLVDMNAQDYEAPTRMHMQVVPDHVDSAVPVRVARQPGSHRLPPAAPVHPKPSKTTQPQLHATETMKGDVERSWDLVQAHETKGVGELIYKKFFELTPDAMNLFPVHVRQRYRDWTADEGDEEGDLSASSALRKLFGRILNAIGCTVAGLHDSTRLVPLLTNLGVRHMGYGVSEALWEPLGLALIETLRDILGEYFTPEVENAWTIVYGFMSSIMIQGLRKARQPAPEMDGESAISQSSQRTGQSEIGELGHDFVKFNQVNDNIQRGSSGSTASTEPM